MSSKISVVLATRNEAANIADCIKSVKGLADEVVVMDESSTDNTRQLANKLGARVFKVKHAPIFHVTKQKAIAKATGDWILQLDADERVTPDLAKEIKKVLTLSDAAILARRPKSGNKWRLFAKHQQLIEAREGELGKHTGEVVAFFVPRRNYFLGRPLLHGGVYPDGVIRLIKRGKARLPAKSVHELMELDGEVAWLFTDLEHHDSPTLARYYARLNRYTDLQAQELKRAKTAKSFWQLVNYSFIKPTSAFITRYLRHAGYKDGPRGFLWAFLSATHYPIAYWKYWVGG